MDTCNSFNTHVDIPAVQNHAVQTTGGFMLSRGWADLSAMQDNPESRRMRYYVLHTTRVIKYQMCKIVLSRLETDVSCAGLCSPNYRWISAVQDMLFRL